MKICNSSDVENLDSTPDVTPLHAAGNPDRYRILLVLLDGPATQKDLKAALKLQSGTLSKHMAVLTSSGLVRQQRPGHAPYELAVRDGVSRLLQASDNLLVERDEAQLARSRKQSKGLNQGVMRPAPSEAGEGELA